MKSHWHEVTRELCRNECYAENLRRSMDAGSEFGTGVVSHKFVSF